MNTKFWHTKRFYTELAIIIILGICALAIWGKYLVYAEYIPLPYETKILVLHNRSVENLALVNKLKKAASNLHVDLRCLDTTTQKDDILLDHILNFYKPDFLLNINYSRMYKYGAINYLLLTEDSHAFIKPATSGIYDLKTSDLGNFEAVFPRTHDYADLQLAYERFWKKFIGFAWTDQTPKGIQENLAKLIALHKDPATPFSYFKYILPYGKLDLQTLPKYLRSAIMRKQTPKYWSLMIAKNHKFTWYVNQQASVWKEVLATIMRPLYKPENAVQIPDGYYFIALADGVHMDFPIPMLSFSGDKDLIANKKVFLIPDYEAFRGYTKLFAEIDQYKEIYTWDKKKSVLFWRGNATGRHYTAKSTFPRLEFIQYVKGRKNIDAAFMQFPVDSSDKDLDNWRKMFSLKNYVPPGKSLQYKYLFDIDGHSCSFTRMAWILHSNSLLFKHASEKMQWFYPLLKPNIHYLMVKEDFSNLEAQIQWAESHPQEVQQIIQNANAITKEIFNLNNLEQVLVKGFIDYQHTIQQY